jgi:hypothetical protein
MKAFTVAGLLGFLILSMGAVSPIRETNVASLRKLGFVPQESTRPGDGVTMTITNGTLKQLESLMKKGKTIQIDERGEIQVK